MTVKLLHSGNRCREDLGLTGSVRSGQVEDHTEPALAAIRFGPDGLGPAIAQQHDSGEVLMLAWMNRESVQATLSEGRGCYWSRSRGKLWRKGETSGQVQYL